MIASIVNLETTRTLRLMGDRLPRVTATVTAAGAMRAMLQSQFAIRFGMSRLPDELHGGLSSATTKHRHLYFLPEDRDGDGRVDHLTFHALVGLGAKALAILENPPQRIHIKQWGHYTLAPVPRIETSVGPTRAWVAATPFIGTRHSQKNLGGTVRPGRSAEEQLAFELARLPGIDGAPLPPAKLRPLPSGTRSEANSFFLGTRLRKGLSKPVRGWFAIEFSEPVHGPLAVGGAAHFGMGQFRPFWEML